MHVIRNTEEIRKFIGEKKTAVALGAFDGLHIGHYKVIRTVVESGLTPVVFTFRDNPAEYLTGTCCYLTTVEERMRILESWGVEYVIMPDFAQVAEWPAERFANLLRFGLNAKRIACGADFRFGKFAAGDTEWLKKLCEAHGGEMHVVPTVEYKGKRVSATRIRKAIENGEMEDVTAMLGRPFGFCFEVVHGNHIGHTIGTPTINQNFPPRFVLPRFGVYASAVYVDGKTYCGVTNVGVKPTVGSDHALSETWMPDFTGGDLYGRTLRLELLSFVRDEKKFPDLDALKAEISLNEKTARTLFEAFEKEYPQVERVMLGRGVMVNPGRLNLICEGKSLDKEVLRAFQDEFYRKNQEVLSGDRAVLFKMKELWFFMIHLFEGAEKAAKKIKKAEKRHVYEECIERLFSDYPLNQKLVK